MAIPLRNGTYQAVRASSVKQIANRTTKMDYRPALKRVQSNHPDNKELQDLKIPEVLGGEIDVLLGIGYNRIFPEIVYTLPSGLQIMKSKFMPATPGEICCVGGPLGTVNRLVSLLGPKASMSYLAHLMSDTYIPRIDYFPTICPEPLKAVFEEYTENNGNKEVNKGEVPDDDDGKEIKKTVIEGKPGKKKNKKGKPTVEKKNLPTTKPVDD